MPVYCNKCGHHNKDGAKFCQSCKDELLATSSDGTLKSGVKLDNRYEIIRLIKTGGMGSVYEALDYRFQKAQCAVKEMLSTATKSQKTDYLIDRFSKEAKILHDLRHPNLPVVKDYFVEGGRYYLVMDYIEGKDLDAVMKDYRGEGVPEELVIRWSMQILSALAYLHNQIPPVIYRDLKPGNVMLRNSDQQILLIDFGIARTINPEQDKTMTAVGTPAFAPMELFQGKSEPRTDIYSLGGTMHCLLTGDVPVNPFCFEPVRNINPHVSEKLEAIVMKALDMDLDNRYDSAEKMMEALGEITVRYTPSPASIALAHSPPTVAHPKVTKPAPGIKDPFMRPMQDSTHLELIVPDTAPSPPSPTPPEEQEARTEADIDLILTGTHTAPAAGHKDKTEADLNSIIHRGETAPSPGQATELPFPVTQPEYKETAPAQKGAEEQKEPPSVVVERPISEPLIIDMDEPDEPEAVETDTISDMEEEKGALVVKDEPESLPEKPRSSSKKGIFIASGILLTVIVLVLGLFVYLHKSDFQENYEEGKKALAIGNYEEAINFFDKALEENPGDQEVLKSQGEALNKWIAELMEEEKYEEVLEIDPDNQEAIDEKEKNDHRRKGNDLMAQENYEEALIEYNEALAIDPDYEEAKDGKKIALKELGDKFKDEDYDKALDYYGEALDIDKDYKEAKDGRKILLKSIGDSFAKKKKYVKALEYYKQASDLDDSYADVWNARGAILQILKKDDKALECYNKALEIDPNLAKSWENKGNILYNQKKYEKALICFNKYLSIDESSAKVLLKRANTLYGLERYEEAIKCYDKVLELEPHNSNAEYYKGEANKALKQ